MRKLLKEVKPVSFERGQKLMWEEILARLEALEKEVFKNDSKGNRSKVVQPDN
jgi:hypothetical protein